MDRSSQIIRTSVVGIAANLLLAAFKALVGVLSHSVAIILDAVNNLTDVLSSVITIVGTKLSLKPADRDHPYGHGRIEYFSAIIIAVIVFSAGATSLYESIGKIIRPTEPSYSVASLIVIGVAVLVKLILGRYVKNKGRELSSDVLVASGSDALFDAVITAATLVSAGIMLIWNVSLDGILGAIISVIIIKAGIEMINKPVSELLGARVSPELTSTIRQEVMELPQVHGVFDLILHNYGPSVMMGSLHVSVDDTMRADEIHALSRQIQEMMYSRHGIVMTVGVYSLATGNGSLAELQREVMKRVLAHPEVVQAHGYFYSDKDHVLSVDVVPDFGIQDLNSLVAAIERELKPLVPPDFLVKVVMDYNYGE